MTAATTRTLLVTGASGHLGRRVVELLLAAAAGDTIVAGSRDPARLADLAARGAVVRRVDFDDPSSLDFAGVDRLLLISTDALDRPGRRVEQHRAAIAAAARAGVAHLVYTSMTNPGPDSPITIAVDHRETEASLAASGLDYTILRNNLYTDYLFGSLPAAVASGRLVNAIGAGAIGYVTREDCARAAAAALGGAGSGRTTLDITGPALVTQAELVAIVGALVGRSIEHVTVDDQALRAGMIAHGLPAGIADVLVSFDRGAAGGSLAVVSDAVLRLTGRAPTGVAEFLAAHRDALAPAA